MNNKCLFCYKAINSGDILKDYHESCSKSFFGIETMPILSLNEKELKQLAEKNVNKRMAVTGVQSKLSLNLEKQAASLPYRLTVVGLWGNYILKPQYKLYPYMPETEDLTMHLASSFKINVSQHALLKTVEGEIVYVVKRFDRKKEEKIHVEDFCQLSGFLTHQKYKTSYEKIASLILKYCTYKGLDALNFFELLLFCFLSGNNDMHLKNFSVMHSGEIIKLSPSYDLINVNIVYPKDKEELALTLNGKKNKINLSDFDQLAAKLQIPQKVRHRIYKKYSQGQEKVIYIIKTSFLNPDYQNSYIETWKKRSKALFL